MFENVNKMLTSAKNSEKGLFGLMGSLGLLRWMPDETYLKIRFKKAMGYELDLDNPQTMCEKMQWLKLYNRRPEYTRMVDKYEAKKFVSEKFGGGAKLYYSNIRCMG